MKKFWLFTAIDALSGLCLLWQAWHHAHWSVALICTLAVIRFVGDSMIARLEEILEIFAVEKG